MTKKRLRLCKEESTDESCKECSLNTRAPGRSRCYSCYGRFRRGTPKPNYIEPSALRILLLDIETQPNLAYVWSLFKTNVGVNQIIQAGEIMCFSAKWYGDDDLIFEHHRNDRLAMIEAAWKLLNEADVVVHYYGSEFDIKWLNREFVENGFPPPRPFKQVDLKKVVSARFNFPSNKLQFVSTQLGLPGKVEHEGFPLWTKCMAGDEEAWARMEEYNRQDVILLEELFEILLPWISNVPNRHLYDPEVHDACPACGSPEIVRDGYYYTSVSRFAQFRCSTCTSVFRSGKRDFGIDLRAAAL